MTSDALASVQMLFSSIWSLFTAWNFPGTHMSPAEWAFFALFLVLLFKFLSRIFNTTVGATEREIRRSSKDD